MMRIGFITFDCRDAVPLIEFWSKVLGYEVNEGVYVTIRDPEGRGPTLYFQEVPEPRTSKNRVHIDLVSESHAVDVDRLLELGATKVGDVEENDTRWTIFQDPEGNEFCLFDAAPKKATA